MIEAQIQEIFSAYFAHHDFSGAGLVKTETDVLHAGAYGYASRPWRIANTLRTRFDTASITKLFTTVAMLQLIDRDALSLQTGVIEFLGLTDTTISRQVTVYQLLTHTSGIGDDADEEAGESYEAVWKTKPNYSVRQTRDFLPQFLHKPPRFPPGSGCRYNNVGFILLGLMIEQISGRPYRDYIRENLFEPLGMHGTDFVSMNGVHHDVAEGYSHVTDAAGAARTWRKNIYSYPPVGSPDSGAYATAGDLDIFVRFLYRGEVLSADLTQALFTPQVDYQDRERYQEKMGFCFHFFVDERNRIVFFKKDGGNAGVNCILSYYPAQDVTLVVLANQDCDVWKLSYVVYYLDSRVREGGRWVYHDTPSPLPACARRPVPHSIHLHR